MSVTNQHLEEIALTEQEYRLIVERLGREPNPVELGMFGALWSEHCGYKHSKPLLREFPSQGSRVLVPRGAENAGVVDIGDGLAVVLKIESHNHPSAVEPFQGAATGVGGIVRDILAMGARPIALLNSLRFGPLSEPHNRYLFEGVVGGISWYGNCIGIPDVGGEVSFAPAYTHNPLVNALCLGLVPRARLARARAGERGNLLLLVGAETGRDGIHGASGLASRTFEEERELRPAVQVANPFLEKTLIEACLEALETGGLEGIQDLGAAGLTSATVEAAARGGGGVELELSQVHLREADMSPYEVLLSESQERMLLVVRPGYEERIKAIFRRWEIPTATIGRVVPDGQVRVAHHGQQVAGLPIQLLTEAPQYRLQGVKLPWLEELQCFPLEGLPVPPEGPGAVLLRLLATSNIASKEGIYRQYDHQVLTNTVVPPGAADAAVLRVRGSRKGLAFSTDGNGRTCYLDPFQGGAIAVAESCRNLSCVGAEPIALTDCLNFGNPERLEIYYQMEECIKGMAAACRVLDVPVVSGNVSLYNETRGQAVYPTPVVGALGLLDEVTRHCTLGFKQEGDLVLLLGASGLEGDPAHLAGSEYLELLHGRVAGQPRIDLELERRVQALCRRAIRQGLLHSAHDCSDGGLAVALAECSIVGGLGFRGTFSTAGRWDATLFGEAPSRIVVSLPPDRLPELERLAQELQVPLMELGVVQREHFQLPGLLDLPLAELAEAWHHGLERALQ